MRGALIAGKYELVERLGRGGMGEVWAARDMDLRRDVAVKFLPHDVDASPELLHRFEREAVAAAQINHPNVVTLHERGVYDGLQFLVMERVDGTSLTERMRGGTPMQLAEALGIVQGICAALVAAHRAKVVHYDIKPSNVMLIADGRVKVVDFGIAGFTHTRTAFSVAPSSALSPAGTLEYGAPEQFLDSRGDERSDLYALGSVLFALLAGQPPFTGANGYIVLRRKIDEDAPPLADLRPDVPAPVGQLIAELLQRNPGQRPQTAEVVHARLARMQSVAAESGQEPDDRSTLPWPSRTTEALRTPPPPSGDHRHGHTLVRTTGRRAVAVYGALVLFALVSVLTAIHQLTVANHEGTEYSKSVFQEAQDARETLAAFLLGAQILCGAGLVACWLVWFARVRAVAEQLAPGQLRYSPSMAVAGWFIPFGNFVLPKQIANDVWHASSPSVRGGGSAPIGLLHTWWAAWLVTFLTWPFFWAPWTNWVQETHGVDTDRYGLDGSYWLLPIVHVLVVPAAAITALYVRRMTAMQAARLDSQPPEAFSAAVPRT
ncbi:protein kinase domain-containing protein [Streptomyces acidicola]|uniref:protein kinase domain-containing protein n=1 Tax=Streptomyces acidicola TaxID=2596892 RepID=UPI0037FF3203